MVQRLKKIIYKLLRKSEKYTKTDMVYLAKGGFWLSLGQVVSSISAFLLAIAFANLLPKETYGTYKYILSLMGILSIPTLSGMGTAVTRAVAQGYDGSFSPALKLKIKWGLLGGLASIVLAGYYYFNNNIELTLAFLITAIFIPFMDSLSLYNSLLQGKKRFDLTSKYGMWIKIIASISIFITLYFTKNLLVILFIYLASYTLLRLLFLKFSLKFIENKKEDPGTISYGKHLSLMGIITMIAGQIDKILIFHFLGANELAIYSIAFSPIIQLKSALKNFLSISLPKFSEQTKENIKKTLPNKVKKAFLLTFFLTIIIYFSLPFIYNLFFPNYIESIKYARFFSLIILLFPIRFLGTAIIAKADKKIVYKLNIFSSLTTIVLILIFLPLFKIWGVAFAVTLQLIISGFISFYYFKKM